MRPPPSSQPLVADFRDLPFRTAKARALAAFESSYFQALLDECSGNVSEAARRAGLDRSNFRRAARRAGIKTRDDS